MTEPRSQTAAVPGQPIHVAPSSRSALRASVWAVIIAGLIFYASSRSQVVSPNVTEVDDKFAHFFVYGLLGTLVCRIRPGWRAALGALFMVSAFGASDEWHQSFVPGRYMDAGDWIADTLGAAVAIALYSGWPWYRRLLERPVGIRQRRIEKS